MSLFGSILGIVAIVSAIWVIYDVLTKNKKVKKNEKIIWIVSSIFFSLITAIVYYFMYKHK